MPRRRRPPRPGALADLAPLRIFYQIIVLQSAYYACATVLIIFTALVAGKDVSLDLLFSWRSLRGDVTIGWMLGLVWMLNSLINVIFLLLLVARSKLIPDFALTVHLIHLIITSLYSHAVPTYWFWWALQITSATLMTFLGIWTCQWRELRPINFGGNSNTGRSDQDDQRNISDEAETDYSRGRGRDRGTDSFGNYEMVGIVENTSQ